MHYSKKRATRRAAPLCQQCKNKPKIGVRRLVPHAAARHCHAFVYRILYSKKQQTFKSMQKEHLCPKIIFLMRCSLIALIVQLVLTEVLCAAAAKAQNID